LTKLRELLTICQMKVRRVKKASQIVIQSTEQLKCLQVNSIYKLNSLEPKVILYKKKNSLGSDQIME